MNDNDEAQEPMEGMTPQELRQMRNVAQDRRRGRPPSLAERGERGRAESPPEKAALKHGVFLQTGTVMRCEHCPSVDRCQHAGQGECPIEVAYIPERQRRMCEAIANDGGDPELIEPLIVSAIWAEVRLERAMRCLAAMGEFHPEAAGEGIAAYQPVALEVPKLQEAVDKRLDALNLTPAARAALEGDRGPGQRTINMILGLGQPGALPGGERQVEDAEFEADNGNGSHRGDAENAENDGESSDAQRETQDQEGEQDGAD